MLIIKGDKNIVTVTRVYIASPEGANGRNVVAYGVLNALTSKYKTMVFRPAVSNHDDFTPILLAASNAGLGVALSTGLDVHKVREDKDTARGDIVGAFNDAMDVSRADAALIVGTDKSHVNDPTSYEFNANVAADLKAGVFLAVCTIDRWPHELDETVKLSIEGMEAAGNKVLGIFVTGCEPRHAFSVKETLAKYGLPVWTLPQIPFTDESTKDLALATFRKNAPTDEVLAALDVDVTAPITPYAFQFGLLGKAKSNKKTIVLPEGEEDRIIKAADYLLEREIVNLIIVGDKDAILARGEELGLELPGPRPLPGHGRRERLEAHGRQAVRAARQEGHDRGAGPQAAGRRQLLRHHARGARLRRRPGLRFRQFHGQHRASGPAGHQDQARSEAGLRRLPHVLQGPRGRVLPTAPST